ncbi:MAG: AAA family ATPase [Clostridia bacterium]|nr:AAA family ATPase [Clostridia bacterium]
MENSNILDEEINKATDILNKISAYYSTRIVGQEQLQKSLLISLISNGHILIESVPGLAKTTAAKTLTDAVNGKFARIQCTPDLLPSDIMGSQIFNYTTNTFETKLGPIYANFVLLDEINRSSAKTQSAMLEAMQEHQTTIGGETYKLPEVFIAIATQNPIEQEGTYMLSEAQLDRFIIKEQLNYPSINEEIEILNRIENNVFETSEAVLNLDDVKFLQNLSKKVYIDHAVKQYIVNIIYATRNPQKALPPNLAKYVSMGSSTRGAISFMQASKALALIRGRKYVTPDDVKDLRYSILRHRIALNYSAVADNVSVEQIIDALVNNIKTP